ncbi:MAG: hypothetical protein GX595_05725 [Lentisphaerae bacterium]|nr:hypothetical protein [Lentisphaerota bacterium]
MLGHHLARTIHVPGALAADVVPALTIPQNCRLVHVSAVALNDSDATLMLGTPANPAGILAPAPIGRGGVPAVFTARDWAPANPTGRLRAGDVLLITLDFDGDSGAAARDVTVDLDFLEG